MEVENDQHKHNKVQNVVDQSTNQKEVKMITATDSGADKNNTNNEAKKEEKSLQVPFFSLFRYASRNDKALMIIGAFLAVLNGLSLPLFSLVFGELIDSFGPANSKQKVVDDSWFAAKWLLIIGASSFFCSWIQMATWMTTGEHQGIQFRKEYLKAIYKQDIAWFDKINPNSITTKLATECFAIQGAIGEKVPTFIQTMTLLIGGFAVAFIKGWELALICTAAIPFIGLASTYFTIQIQTADSKIADSYSEAAGLCEQATTGIKTVKSLNGQTYEQDKYAGFLKHAYLISLKYGKYIGIGLGGVWFIILADYAIGFWFGSIFVGEKTNNAIYDRPYTAGDVIAIFFSIMMGGFSVGQATPCLKNFGLGKQAGYSVFQVIDSKPTISPSLNSGEKIEKLQGNIELKNVEFTYPTKEDVQVLKKINILIKAGQKTALVGESGCGKSTIIQLIERFYDVDQGELLIDGKNIKNLNLSWLRQNIGYVGQEPVLFATTIKENLKLGKPDATDEELVAALKQANAYDFINQLADKMDTYVGSAGSQLSGGQKQRICIARAILKNPPIILLDEATSALDRQNERSIQETLDKISKERTTIVIAHRLSTIRNADHIMVIDKGELVEEGNHDQLLAQQGKYASLCQNQLQKEKEEEQGIQKQEDNEDSDSKADVHDKNPRLTLNGLQKQAEVKNHSNVVASMLKKSQLAQEEGKEMTAEEKKQLQAEIQKENKQMLQRLSKLNAPEKSWMYLGSIFSFISGTCFPFCGLVMAHMLKTLAQVDILGKDEYREDSDRYGLYFLIISIVSGVCGFLQCTIWRRVAEGLTMRLRETAFDKILKMPCSWFDEKENNPGSLSTRIGQDTQVVNGLTSTVINIQIANMSSLITGLAIGFAFDWRTTLVSLSLFPFIFMAGFIQAKFNQGFSELTDKVYRDSGKLVQESVTNMRTVASFGCEKIILQNYSEKLKEPAALIAPKSQKSGLSFGLSQFIIFVVYAVQFYVAAIFHREYGTDSVDMFTAIFAVLYAAFGAGNNNQFMTDIGAAYQAARNIFAILDTQDEYQFNIQQNGEEIKKGEIEGVIEFKNVSFKYPSREKVVLKNVSFKVNQGEKVAFVGPSGCGKSTIMQLLMRFYEPLSGQIFLDGKEIHNYDIDFLRKQFGVVNQEPILFQGTIEQNIRYNTEHASFDDVQNAAKQANSLTFIEQNQFEKVKEGSEDSNEKDLGSGFQRQVGNKGNQLSGGQKQRIAIARAIIKKPKILLLDEATSALDSTNEAIVQDSLNALMKNKTTLAIAHRISTIKDSNNIIVIEDGHLVEQGKYEELQLKKGYFYRLERGEQH